MEKESDYGLLAGLIMGTAIGLSLGLLYAPRPGAKTRDMLRKRTDEMRSRAEALGDSVMEKASMMHHSLMGDGSRSAEAK
jgi:gas vesicle protein